MIATTIQRWIAMFSRKPSMWKEERGFRPRLEILEERECPAIFNPADATALIAAFTTANTNNQADVINLAPNTVYTLNAAIPDVVQDSANPANTITLNGNGATIARSGAAPAFRIFNITDGRLTINSTTITGGSVAGFGGGIRVADAAGNNGTNDNLVLRNSTVTGNTTIGATVDGGGIAVVAGGKASIINSTISGNSAATNGGGISVLNTAQIVNVVSSTIARNVAVAGVGGGLNVEGGAVTLDNSILADNHLVSLAGAGSDVSQSGGTVNARNTLFQVAPPGTVNLISGNIVNQNPQLGVLQNNSGLTPTHAITT
ncbi:MAG: hypothetical protein K8T89_24900, partial [Planctomycetes bacterium]|nr:hypothetical protein [Planctomycetota bacterium]